MISLSQALLFTAAFGVSAATPGLEVLAIFARAMDKAKSGLAQLVLGIVTGKLVLLAVAMAGLAALASTFSTLFVVVGFLGAAYLAHLAIKKWRSAGTAVELTGRAESHSSTKSFAIGFALTMSNPIAVVFYLAILPGVVDLERPTIVQYLTLAGVIVVVMSAIALAYGLAGAKVSQLFSGRGKLAIDRVTAGTFLACSVLLVIRSWP